MRPDRRSLLLGSAALALSGAARSAAEPVRAAAATLEARTAKFALAMGKGVTITGGDHQPPPTLRRSQNHPTKQKV